MAIKHIIKIERLLKTSRKDWFLLENIDRLPERLRYFREQKKMSRKQVCAALNITPSAISYWESGKRKPDADVLLELCELYGIRSISQLFGNTEPLTDEITDSEKYLIELYRNADKAAQTAVVKLLRSWNMWTQIMLAFIQDIQVLHRMNKALTLK